jgi:hypothetical protein
MSRITRLSGDGFNLFLKGTRGWEPDGP